MDSELILALAAFVVGVVAVVAFMTWCMRDAHEVYDPGDGSVKIRCPDDIGSSSVLYGWGSKIVCPVCGARLTPPTKKNVWQKR